MTSSVPPPPAHPALASELEALLRRYVYMPDEARIAMVLWILYSHVSEVFWHQPRLVISSPTKRSGKTTVLKLLKALCAKPVLAANATPAALYRLIESKRPTVLLDEADTYFRANEEMRGLINSGFEPDEVIWRCSGDSHEPKPFRCSCPVAIAGIGSLADTIIDRSVVLNMERKPRKVEVERFDGHRQEFWTEVRGRIEAWAEHSREALHSWEPEVTGLKSDRAVDVWRPLLAIAEMLGGDWPEKARAAARKLSAASSTALDEDHGQLLLGDIRKVFLRTAKDRLSSQEICTRLAEFEDRPWPDWSRGRPITPPQLARLLRPFKIGPMSIRLPDGSTPKGYLRAGFEDAWTSYL